MYFRSLSTYDDHRDRRLWAMGRVIPSPLPVVDEPSSCSSPASPFWVVSLLEMVVTPSPSPPLLLLVIVRYFSLGGVTVPRLMLALVMPALLWASNSWDIIRRRSLNRSITLAVGILGLTPTTHHGRPYGQEDRKEIKISECL